MKKLITLVLAAFVLTVSVNAQQPAPTTPEKPATKKENAKKMAEELGLSREQSKEMVNINKSFRDKVQAIKDDGTLTDAAKKEKIKALNTEKQAEVNKILTPEQQTKFEAMKKEKMAEHKQKKEAEKKAPQK